MTEDQANKATVLLSQIKDAKVVVKELEALKGTPNILVSQSAIGITHDTHGYYSTTYRGFPYNSTTAIYGGRVTTAAIKAALKEANLIVTELEKELKEL